MAREIVQMVGPPGLVAIPKEDVESHLAQGWKLYDPSAPEKPAAPSRRRAKLADPEE